MSSKSAKKEAKREPLPARPEPETDRKALRADIAKRFAKSLDHLAK